MPALISYRNLADTAVLTGSPMAGYPLSQLQVRQLSDVCRISTLSSQIITVDLGSLQRIDLVAMLGVNHATGARATTDLQVQTALVSGGPWTSVSASLPQDAGSPDLPRHIIAATKAGDGSPLATRFLRFTLGWNTGGAAYREIGRLYIGRAIELEEGIEGNWTLSANDPGSLDASVALQYYEERRDRGRLMHFRHGTMPCLAAYGFPPDAVSVPTYVPSVDDLFMAAGTTGDVIFIPRSQSPLWIRRTAIYGHFTEDSLAMDQVDGDSFAWSGTVVEEH